MVAGLTIGKNTGGLNSTAPASAQSSAADDLNDPNFTAYTNGIVGNDSDRRSGCRAATELPYAISLAATLVSNRGYPYMSTYSVTRALARRRTSRWR